MKKIAIFGLMFFIIFSQLFSDENIDKFKNNKFSWQFSYYQENNQEIDFIYLNPLFFINKYLLNNYVYINQITNSQNNSSQNNRNTQSYSKENDWLGFALYMGGIIASNSVMNRQERNIYDDTWKQQEEMKKIYQRKY